MSYTAIGLGTALGLVVLYLLRGAIIFGFFRDCSGCKIVLFRPFIASIFLENQAFFEDRASVLRSESRSRSSCARDFGNRRRFFNSLDLRVQPLNRGIGDAVFTIGQQ